MLQFNSRISQNHHIHRHDLVTCEYYLHCLSKIIIWQTTLPHNQRELAACALQRPLALNATCWLCVSEHNWTISPVSFSPQSASSSFLCLEEDEPALQHKANIPFPAQINSLSCYSFSSSHHENKKTEFKWVKIEVLCLCLDVLVQKKQSWV